MIRFKTSSATGQTHVYCMMPLNEATADILRWKFGGDFKIPEGASEVGLPLVLGGPPLFEFDEETLAALADRENQEKAEAQEAAREGQEGAAQTTGEQGKDQADSQA